MTFIQVLITSLFAFLFTRAVGSVVAPEGATHGAGRDARSVRRPMVRCATCGVYVLRDRALPAPGGAFACSTACQERR
jgi:hypothetical protein